MRRQPFGSAPMCWTTIFAIPFWSRVKLRRSTFSRTDGFNSAWASGAFCANLCRGGLYLRRGAGDEHDIRSGLGQGPQRQPDRYRASRESPANGVCPDAAMACEAGAMRHMTLPTGAGRPHRRRINPCGALDQAARYDGTVAPLARGFSVG
jgi:hypothetical protein